MLGLGIGFSVFAFFTFLSMEALGSHELVSLLLPWAYLRQSALQLDRRRYAAMGADRRR